MIEITPKNAERLLRAGAKVYASRILHVYKRPDSQSEVVTVVSRKSYLGQVESLQNGWVKLRYNVPRYVPATSLYIDEADGLSGVRVTDQQLAFVRAAYSHALKAQEKFGIPAEFMLAQSAIETGWGTSGLALKSRNYFGIIATKNGSPYWNGTVSSIIGVNRLRFRQYQNIAESFLDHAWLIATKSIYRKVYEARNSGAAAYAKAMSESPYIAEENGDNRAAYQKNIAANVAIINEAAERLELKKK